MNKKIALVTGATSGIGYETARILAKNNFDLIITGRRNDRLIQLKKNLETENHCEVVSLNFDIRNKTETLAALEGIHEKWKSIDVLINNAGLAAGYDPLSEASMDDFETMIDTNIKGLLYVSQTVSRWMIARKSGHIINLSSIAGKEPYPNGTVYCGTKHAVESITKALRIELIPYGIKVSSIAPGAVNTEFSKIRFHGNAEKAEKVYEGFTPLSGPDIAETILFMVTRPAHVNIDDILIMPTSQASARDIHRNK